MFKTRLIQCVVAALLAVTFLAGPAWAVEPDKGVEGLYKAYYLEHAQRDYAAAQRNYASLLDGRVDPSVRDVAQSGYARCRDNLAAQNMATLMPPDALAYIELNRPGEIVQKLAEMLGLTGKSMQEILATRPSADASGAFRIPDEIVISPALFEALSSFGGAGAAITSFDPEGNTPPAGVLVIHHGDTDILRGLLETGFQFSPTAEKIHDMPTFGIAVPELGRVVGVLTEALLIVGTDRDLVSGVVDRLVDPKVASLASRDDLSEVAEQREGATLFVYADIQAVLRAAKANMSEGDLREFNAANAIADLDSFRWAALSFGIHEGTLGANLAIRLADNHHSIAYNLTRLTPLGHKSLAKVPPDAAAIFALGLNPALVQTAADAAQSRAETQGVTGFDLGREFFGNIQEICVYVVPGKMSTPERGPDVVPNIGIVLTVNDISRSKALWDQFLALPGLIGNEGEPIRPKEMKIGTTPVTAYAIPDFGRIYLTELDNALVIGATRTATKAAIRAQSKGESILDEGDFARAFEKMPRDTSMMAVAHFGRLAEVARGMDGPEAMSMAMAEPMLSDMVGWAAIGQAHNQFSISVALRGLPNVNVALKQFGPMLDTVANAAATQMSKPSRKAVRSGETVETLTAKVIAAAQKGDHDTALKLALKAREISDNGLTNYNVACMHSLRGEKDAAFAALFRAIELGMNQNMAQLLETDSDLDNIREDARFEKALSAVKSGKHAGTRTTKSL